MIGNENVSWAPVGHDEDRRSLEGDSRGVQNSQSEPSVLRILIQSRAKRLEDVDPKRVAHCVTPIAEFV